jgi:hypothetical protein
MLVRFDSVDAYIREVRKVGADRDESLGRNWDMNVNGQEAARLAVEGDPSLVQQAEKIVDKHLATRLAQGTGLAWTPAITGARVDVPAYLGGNPLNMRRRTKVERMASAVSIYVSNTCSYGISAEKMLHRGCVILALLSYLQASNITVDLYMLSETHGRTDGDFYQAIQVESRPLDLSTASFAIAHPAFARHTCYSYATIKDGFNGSWPRSYDNLGGSYQDPRYEAHVRTVLGMVPTDIYVPAVHYNDPLTETPERWLNERISQLCVTR